jgi:formylglycine-generating enzyme required for sulfatase activity
MENLFVEEISLTMVKIPAGSFLMGSPENEPGRSEAEGPQHGVTLTAFWMAKTPITQAQWREVASWPRVKLDLRSDPSHFKGDQRPVEGVNWFEAMEFCDRLSQRTGQRYGLPSEAQWEYACRAGSTTPFQFGATLTPDLANCGTAQTTDVASFPANNWGLQDMHGNVWEWCLDEWHESYEGAPSDGRAWVDAVEGQKSKELVKTRLLRGGSWLFFPGDCRSACRDNVHPDSCNDDVGFRVCCLPQD